jgi:hypothetical protein
LAARAGAAVRHLMGPHVLLQLRHVEHRPGFEQQHRDAEVGEHFRDRAASRARANHHDIVDGGIRRLLGHL